MFKARLIATGSYLPEKILTTEEIIQRAAVFNGAPSTLEPATVVKVIGAVERREAREDQACSDLIVEAARNTLEAADVKPEELDRIFVSATPGDYFEPSTASVVQYKLGATCPAIDIKASCVGWVAGLDYAFHRVEKGEDRLILVAAGTKIGKMGMDNPFHRSIFGDGAGAALVGPSDRQNVKATYFWTKGEYYDVITMPHGHSIRSAKIPMEFDGKFYMGNRETIFGVLREYLSSCLNILFARSGCTRDDVDYAFIHQASGPIFEETVGISGILGEKIHRDYRQYGNTISAELPISLDNAVRKGAVGRDDRLLLVTYGAGFTGGGVVLDY